MVFFRLLFAMPKGGLIRHTLGSLPEAISDVYAASAFNAVTRDKHQM